MWVQSDNVITLESIYSLLLYTRVYFIREEATQFEFNWETQLSSVAGLFCDVCDWLACVACAHVATAHMGCSPSDVDALIKENVCQHWRQLICGKTFMFICVLRLLRSTAMYSVWMFHLHTLMLVNVWIVIGVWDDDVAVAAHAHAYLCVVCVSEISIN